MASDYRENGTIGRGEILNALLEIQELRTAHTLYDFIGISKLIELIRGFLDIFEINW